MNRCVFLDRDGVVNRRPTTRYVERWDDFVLLPQFPDVLRLVTGRGYVSVIVTNQSGVSRGVMSMEAVDDIHRHLQALLRQEHGLELLDVMCCPHGEGECDCRKPQPGMLVTASERHDIDLGASWMVGDQEKDIEAGRRAGCSTVLVDGPDPQTAADHRVADLAELQTLLARVL